MKKILLLIIGIFILFPISKAQENKDNEHKEVKWYTFEEAEELSKKNPKPIFVKVYTGWCGYCKKMDKVTFTNKEVNSYLNVYFYPVKFDAESRKPIKFNGKVYKDTILGNKRHLHRLAIELLGGKMSYPTSVIIDKNKQKSVLPGYIEPKKLLPVLVYFAEEINKSTNYDNFEKYFNKTYPPDNSKGYTVTRSLVKWIDMEEAFEKNKTNPKKIFIDVNVNWRVASTIMMISTYNDPVIAEILNKYYYPVRFDATSKDTLNVMGVKYINENKGHPYHQLAVAMLEGKMKFPANLYMNEKNQLVNKVQAFLTPKDIEPMLMYFAKDEHKKIKWPEYRKKFVSKIEKEENKKINDKKK